MAHPSVICYGIVIEMPFYPGFCSAQHLSFSQFCPGFLRPFRKLSQALAHLLAAGSAIYFEPTFPGFPTVEGESQECKFSWFSSLFACSGISSAIGD